MAFTGNYLCTSFKKQLLEGVHDFRVTGGDTFKLALYTDLASFDANGMEVRNDPTEAFIVEIAA